MSHSSEEPRTETPVRERPELHLPRFSLAGKVTAILLLVLTVMAAVATGAAQLPLAWYLRLLIRSPI